MKRRTLITGMLGLPLLGSVYAGPLRAAVPRALQDVLITTPREQLQPWVVEQIRAGRLRKPALIKALLAAGVSQIEPRPVGFKYHAVLMVDAARRLSQEAEGIASWIPLLWNVDYFKHSQARSQNLSDWQLTQAVAGLPALGEAGQQFSTAMQAGAWQQADRAITRLARSGSMHQVFALMLAWAVRDFHSIGHKAILLAGVWRSLEYCGWANSETILRGTTYALLADGNVAADQTTGWWLEDYPHNMKLATGLPDSIFLPGSDQADSNRASTIRLLKQLRQPDTRVSAALAAQLLQQGMPLQSLWDAVFLAAAEAVMNRPTIPMLHSITVSHALYSLWQRTADPQMRRVIPLQAASYVVQMKQQRSEGGWQGLDLLALQPESTKDQGINEADYQPDYQHLGTALGYQPQEARAWLLGYPLASHWPALRQQLNQWLLYKSNKAHDFKYGAAVLESVEWLSPHWRGVYLAASSRLLLGSQMPDSVEGQQIGRWLGQAFD